MIAIIGDLIVKAALALGVLVLSVGGAFIAKEGIEFVNEANKPQSTPAVKSEFIEPSPTLTPAPISKPTDPDPVVTCQFRYLPWQKMRLSECKRSIECQVGTQWYIYNSQEECTKAQVAHLVSQSQVRQGTPTEPLLPCLIGSITIPATPSDCVRFQNINNQAELQRELEFQRKLGEIESQPTLDTSQSQANQNNELSKQNNSQCKMEARQWYENQVSQYGATSTREAAEQILLPQYQQKVADCDARYPVN